VDALPRCPALCGRIGTVANRAAKRVGFASRFRQPKAGTYVEATPPAFAVADIQ
jgi:hypothetical protein